MDFCQIQIVASDIDGTLTDGGMYYTSSGETFKRFSVKDGLGVKLLQAIGIEVAFISSDDSPIILERGKRLGLRHCYAGVEDKVAVAKAICEEMDVGLDGMAYLGDDLQDLELLQSVGLGAAVGDAHSMVKEVAYYVCKRAGGQNAFREFAEWLIVQQGRSVQNIWRNRLPKMLVKSKGA